MPEKDTMLKWVTYCGLYCGLCSARCRTPKQARMLHATMKKDGYETWGDRLPGFKEFWAFLSNLADESKRCPGCRGDGGPPFCGIRKCARGREIDICVNCPEYPCEKIRAIEKGYPTLVADGLRLREIGLEQWVTEQEERVKTGFAYVDIRTYPYHVPE